MTSTHGNRAQLLLTSTPNVTLTNQVLTASGDHKTFAIGSASTSRYWDRTAAWTIQAEYDEVQTLTVTGGPTGGTFVLRFGGQNTSTIAYNASAATVQTALQALTSIGANNALVTGPVGGPWVVEFTGTLGFASQALITLQTNSLTGGSGPSVNIVESQLGQGWTTMTSTTYAIQYVGGKIIFNNAFLGASVGCRVTGAYLPFTAIGIILEWAPDISRKTHPTTCMTTNNVPTRWETFQPGLAGGTIKINRFLVDNTYVLLFPISTDDTLILSLVMDATTGFPRMESYGKLTKDSMKAPIKDLEMEDLDFVIDGQMVLTTS